MNKLIILLALLIQNTYALDFPSQVHSISESPSADEPHIVKWADGTVSFLDSNDQATLETLRRSMTTDKGQSFSIEESRKYQPTILNSDQEAQAILKRNRSPNPFQFNIQCYNLAHVRAYEEYKYSGLKSMKIFLFFTDSYIRKYRHKWWFHVTPMTLVKHQGKIERRVLDKEWSKTPLAVKTWTDIFMKSKSTCPEIRKYSQYESNQEAHDCYIQPVSMYYWQPIHLIQLENGVTKEEFHMGEVNTAYRRDF